MTLSTWTARANTVFSYFGVVMAVLIGAHVASTYFLHPTVRSCALAQQSRSHNARAGGARAALPPPHQA